MAWARGRQEGYGLKSEAIKLATEQGIKLKLKRQTSMGMNHVIMYRNGIEWFREWNVQDAWGQSIIRMNKAQPAPTT